MQALQHRLCFLFNHRALLLGAILSALLPSPQTEAGPLQIWPVDPLTKIFRDDKPAVAAVAQSEAARGEHAAFQVVVRSDFPVTGLRARVSTLSWGLASDTLTPARPRWVGYVPVDRPIQNPPKDQLRQPPADFPDPLLELETIDLGPGANQAVWITVPVPTNCLPGVYRGTLTFRGSSLGKAFQTKQQLELTVHRAIAGPAPLWVTDWFAMHWPHMSISPKPESDEYYGLLRKYARNMADHRHNVALISPLDLAIYTPGPENRVNIDFSRFDRWVRIFQDEGVVGRIEGGHIGGRKGAWESAFVVTVRTVKKGKIETAHVDPASPEADTFYSQFFPALVKHLNQRGWLSIYLQHLADEPIAANIASYRAMADLLHKYAPELRVIEACHTKDLVGAINVWVPQLNYLQQDFEHYQARQKAGDEVWFYTCVFPQGEYANRFIEQPLIKTRLLHWINYRYGVTGYLHWGYNHWTQQDPFTHTTRPHGGPPYLPAGDPWIVYPGPAGPLDSIRFEAMRDGIADYALLAALGEKDPAAAQELSRKLILDFDSYTTDLKTFRAVRHELLTRLSSTLPKTAKPQR